MNMLYIGFIYRERYVYIYVYIEHRTHNFLSFRHFYSSRTSQVLLYVVVVVVVASNTHLALFLSLCIYVLFVRFAYIKSVLCLCTLGIESIIWYAFDMNIFLNSRRMRWAVVKPRKILFHFFSSFFSFSLFGRDRTCVCVCLYVGIVTYMCTWKGENKCEAIERGKRE